MSRPSRALLAALGLAVLLAGCSAKKPKASWVKDEVPAAQDEILWDVTRLAMQKAGFPVVNDVDRAHRRATSGWYQDLAPFRRRGYREQAIVEYTPAGDGRLALSVRVKRELNMDIVKPLDPTYADWEADADDEGRARIIVQYIKAYLGERVEFAEPAPRPFGQAPGGANGGG